ncbi:MAG: ribonuclease E/G [Clostridia bacterium]
MLEILIKRTESERQIALVENEKIIEFYDEKESEEKKEGNIYVGVVKDVVKGMQAAFIDIGIEKNSLIHLKDILEKKDEKMEEVNLNQEITKILKPNQKLLVQIKKDSNERKGARTSTHINLPGKYVVLMPNTNIVTISQKINNVQEQERLLKIVKENISKENGAIIRTSAEGKEKEVIEEIKKLEKKWQEIFQKSRQENIKAPRLLYKSEDIVEKMLIDLADKNVDSVTVNDSRDYNQISNIKSENKEYKNLKILIKGEQSIFDKYNLKKQISKISNRKIWLKMWRIYNYR